MQEMQVWSLDGEDSLKEEMANHSSVLALKIQWTEEPGGYSPWGRRKSDSTEQLSTKALLSHSYQGITIRVSGFYSMVSSIQSLSRVWLFATPWTAARQASLSITKCQSLLKLMSIESVMPSNHLILCCPLLLPPSILPSIRVFSNESVLCIRWPKYWNFSLNISPSNEYSGLIFFRMDWLELLAVQGTLKSLLQHHSSKTSILQHSAFFIVQLSHPYMTTRKTIDLTRWIFVGKVMSLLLNMLSRLVITFLPRSKRLLSIGDDLIWSHGWEPLLRLGVSPRTTPFRSFCFGKTLLC